MKTILRYLRRFIAQEFHPGLYAAVVLFLAASIWANYSFSIDDTWIDTLQGTWIQIPVYLLFYGVPYLFGLLAWAFFTGNRAKLRQPGLWGHLSFGLILLSVNSWFHYHNDLAVALFPEPAYLWASKLFWNMKSSLAFLVPLFLFWQVFDKENVRSLYGLTRRNFDAKPYFLMLLVVLPGILWASFQTDFMAAYPHYRPGAMEEAMGWNPWLTTFTLQFFYGLDFTFVELFFRGFLVIGLTRWLGPGVILPMVTTYCFLHFGKPMGEAIASIFGGYLLGVFAYYSRSIFGGVIAHWGLAWTMELCAYAQLFLHGSTGKP